MPDIDPASTYQRLVVGFHGCDRSVLERVVLDGGDLAPSDNPYDWLGRGIYFHTDLVVRLGTAGSEVPTNRKGGRNDFDLVLRHLDCAVINHAMAVSDALHTGGPYFQTVRGVFVEGGPAFEGAGIQHKSHVQVTVRDPSCILGYFVPRTRV